MTAAESFRSKTTAELLAIRAERKFTADERAVLFGDPSHVRTRDAYESELVRRLDAGESLTRADRRDARRIKRDRRAGQ